VKQKRPNNAEHAKQKKPETGDGDLLTTVADIDTAIVIRLLELKNLGLGLDGGFIALLIHHLRVLLSVLRLLMVRLRVDPRM